MRTALRALRAASFTLLAGTGCHIWASEPAPGDLVGELFHESPYSRGLGWTDSEFIEVRPVSLAESLEYPRAVFALHMHRRERAVTTFLLPGYVLHVPLGVAGNGLYVKVAAQEGGGFHLVRFALAGNGRDTLARNVPIDGFAASADEEIVAYTRPGAGSVAADSLVVLHRSTGGASGSRHPGGIALLAVSPVLDQIAVERTGASDHIAGTIDIATGIFTPTVTLPRATGRRVSFWPDVAWRPEGPRMAFVRQDVGSRASLWVVDAPGAPPREVLLADPSVMRGGHAFDSNVHPLAWLAGGDRLAIIHNHAADGTTTVSTLKVATGETTVAARGAVWVFPSVEPHIAAPARSLFPDGERALVRDRVAYRALRVQ